MRLKKFISTFLAVFFFLSIFSEFLSIKNEVINFQSETASITKIHSAFEKENCSDSGPAHCDSSQCHFGHCSHLLPNVLSVSNVYVSNQYNLNLIEIPAYFVLDSLERPPSLA